MSKTTFFTVTEGIIAVLSGDETLDITGLEGLFAGKKTSLPDISGNFVGPRRSVLSPWSSNVTAILAAAGHRNIRRCELFKNYNFDANVSLDAMLEQKYSQLDQSTLVISGTKAPLVLVEDIQRYSQEFGLALSEEEIEFLRQASADLGRPLTDTEVYGFGQINSEHCRHKIFNADFVIDGEIKTKSLFALIKDTTKAAGTHVVSAYKDNVAFIDGMGVAEFAPRANNFFTVKEQDYVVSLKAETHNFPTTVEPFYGASTGSGGEIRDRMAGGQGGQVLSGLAVYMTSSPRVGAYALPGAAIEQREWAHQSPQQILTKASNGASDFGNKFGQPLTCGSLVTAELQTDKGLYAFDRCIMLAGGVGVTPRNQAQKKEAASGDLVVVLGGENFRIGMAGGSVSSVDSGQTSVELELSAVQRANPEMQKRVYNVVRSLVENAENPVKLIHDHGAGGHINCLSELIEATGGIIDIDALPVGDPTLSLREILCNESQERMGLVIAESDLETLRFLCERERAPLYVVGKITGDKKLCYKTSTETAFSLPAATLFGSSPKLTLSGESTQINGSSAAIPIATDSKIDANQFSKLLNAVLSLEGVGSKDWLTNKVDRCVSGRVARQQCVGVHQLPLANCAITAADYISNRGIATALGSAPLISLIDSAAGARVAVAESLLNLSFAPLAGGLEKAALSANWMWPAKQPGENSRLYKAVEALSVFCIALKIPVPTGKDSLSMTMQYPTGEKVRAPGTVVVTAVAPTEDFRKTVLPVFSKRTGTCVVYADFSGQDTSALGGSALLQIQNALGTEAPDIKQPENFKNGFNLIQELISRGLILAGHDVSYGGLITSLLEMSFASDVGVSIDTKQWQELFTEKPGIVLQILNSDLDNIVGMFTMAGLRANKIADVLEDESSVQISNDSFTFTASVSELRDVWYSPSAAMEKFQSPLAEERRENFTKTPLHYRFPQTFTGFASDHGIAFYGSANAAQPDQRPIAAVVREQGTNGERELAFALDAAGFRVKDITMTDLISGREDLSDASFLGFPGGFSFSDCLGAGKGWAASFQSNPQAKAALTAFYARADTLSVGICNGCQVMAALNLQYPEAPYRMHQNKSKKFESSFVAVEIEETASIMLQPLIGSRLGIWVSHGEGLFTFPIAPEQYDIPVKYVADSYPANPNGSPLNAAAVCSKDGRHLAIMPHLERSSLPWHWGHYPEGAEELHEISPWMLAFVAAKNWIDARRA